MSCLSIYLTMSHKEDKMSSIFYLNHTYLPKLLPRTCRTQSWSQFSWAESVAAACDKERTRENSGFGLKDFFGFNINVKKKKNT